MEIIGIYNAYSGILGELKYTIGKIMGTTHCALCEITHGWHPLGKAEWRQEIKWWGNLKNLHINDQPPEMKAITQGQTPCIVLAKQKHVEIIVTSQQLKACDGNVQAMLNLIRDTLSQSVYLNQ